MGLMAKIELGTKVITWGIDEPITPELVNEIASGLVHTKYRDSKVYGLFTLLSKHYEVETLIEQLFDEDKELIAEIAMLLVLNSDEIKIDEKSVADSVVFTRLYLPVLLAIIAVEMDIHIDL